jgi:hypothetical protein
LKNWPNARLAESIVGHPLPGKIKTGQPARAKGADRGGGLNPCFRA